MKGYRKGRIRELNHGSKTKDVGKIDRIFGKVVYFRAPRNKYKLNDMVYFKMLPNGEAEIVGLVESKGWFRRKKRY